MNNHIVALFQNRDIINICPI